jgi:hypothetical protein
MNNLHYYPSFPHNLLIHEFYHSLPKVIRPMFFVVFWDYQKLKLGLITSYSNMGCPCYNKCKTTTNCTTFLAFCLAIPFATWATRFSPFLHISFNIIVNFLVTCMLTKKISQVRASNLSFPSTSLQALHLIICKSPFDPMHNFAHGSFATHESWNLFVAS